jgi:RNase H-fold protein (predicted Holliday junction resolvase)
LNAAVQAMAWLDAVAAAVILQSYLDALSHRSAF